MLNRFTNKETYHAALWINNTEEFYVRVCKAFDLERSPSAVERTIKNIINEVVKSHESGVGSKEAMYMLEDIGNVDLIVYDEVAEEFLAAK